jgi:hypothetical protein
MVPISLVTYLIAAAASVAAGFCHHRQLGGGQQRRAVWVENIGGGVLYGFKIMAAAGSVGCN